MNCPRCQTALVQSRAAHGVFFRCPGCNGQAAGMAMLRNAGGGETVKRLWTAARQSHGTSGARCPSCGQLMKEAAVPVRGNSPPLRLDLCPACQFVWFDPHEYEQVPLRSPTEPRRLPEKAREAIAVLDAKRAANAAERAAYESSEPSEWWHMLPGVLGMPVEENAPPLRSWPWATWGIAVLLVAVFALTVTNLRAVVVDYGLVPAMLWRHHGATLITSFFLHGGLLHLVGNVYFLLVFGDNVEDDLGPWRFLLLLLAADLAGSALHVLGDPTSIVPCIGASGGISGVIVYYAFRFPRVRLAMMGYYFYWVRFPAYVGLLFWIVMQAALAVQQRMGVGDVAAFAHLGGAAVGAAAWALKTLLSPKHEPETVY